jgi:ABC-2 type transport system ATP-binding protein
MQAIITENLVKTYGKGAKAVKALDGVSFSVRQGEIFGLLGPNGAGKSTTVRILATLTRADAGRAVVADCDIMRDPALARRRIGYVAQAMGVDKWATGRENLVLQAQLQKVARGDIAERVTRLLKWVGLTEAADRIVKGYSGGMKRRLDLATGLVNEPSVLFLDEPTTGLDPETRAALWRDLERLRDERNLTVLLTTHYLEEADRLCDRLAIVDRGKVVVEGTPSDLKASIRGDTVTLEVDASDAGRSAELLRPLEGVHACSHENARVTARVNQGATALPGLVTALERAGIAARSVTVGRPSLDDVYLHHTGRRYDADGGQKNPGEAA